MKTTPKKKLPGISIAYPDDMLLPEIRQILKVIMVIAWINLAIGLINLMLYFPRMHNASLASTGILSILMFSILRPMIQHAANSKNWCEICLTAICGIYLPSFTFWISFSNMVHTINY